MQCHWMLPTIVNVSAKEDTEYKFWVPQEEDNFLKSSTSFFTFSWSLCPETTAHLSSFSCTHIFYEFIMEFVDNVI